MGPMRSVKAAKPGRNDWKRIRRLFRPHLPQTALIAGLAFVGGLVEAAYLVAIARAALSLTSDDPALEFAGHTLSIAGTLALAGVLVLARSGLVLGAGCNSFIAMDIRNPWFCLLSKY